MELLARGREWQIKIIKLRLILNLGKNEQNITELMNGAIDFKNYGRIRLGVGRSSPSW